jgi:hypothetical protein
MRLASIAEKVKAAQDGNMNCCLHWGASQLAWVIWVEGLATKAEAVSVLMQAVEANGLVQWHGRDQCLATIESGFRNGVEGLTIETLLGAVGAALKGYRINALGACAERAAEMGIDLWEAEALFMQVAVDNRLVADKGERLCRATIRAAFERVTAAHAMMGCPTAWSPSMQDDRMPSYQTMKPPQRIRRRC